jgi:16S rRNA (cytosine1402-N4)-methyltransferase
MTHIPVLKDEIVTIFREVPEGFFIDATFGFGGHSRAIFETCKQKLQFIGIDCDQEIIMEAQRDLPSQFKIYNSNFEQLTNLIIRERIEPVSGILFDLGLNSLHIDNPQRGFSFQNRGPLDMRFDRAHGKSLADYLSETDEKSIANIIQEYGQERKARAIAREIVKSRPLDTISLADVVRRAVGPRWFVKSAARVFQALRIFLNNELENLKTALNGVIPLIQVDGRIAVISYHSLEDGIVKRAFQLNSGKCFCGPNQPSCCCGARKILQVLAKKPIQPTEKEISLNPRSRSARLRYAQRL